MNTIFIDFKDDIAKENKLDKIKNKLFKYVVKDDILNGVLSKNTYITIDREYIQNQLKKCKYSYYDKLLKFNINRKYKKNESANLVFSKEFDKYVKIKEYILDLFRLNKITAYNEIVIPNNLKLNDTIYIEKYIKDNKKDLNKFKILIILDNITDYDETKLLEYISKYKFIDILKTKNINKYEYNKLLKNIQRINNEYGTTIDIIQKRNIQKYDVYLVYSNLDKMEFLRNYILSNKSLYINMLDVDLDVLSEEYICYERYEPEILTLLNRLRINANNFSKVKLGFLFK